MNRRERVYAIAVTVLLVLLIVKSLVLDPVKLEDENEIEFASWVETKIEKEFDGFIYDSNLFVHRLVSVKKTKKTEENEELYVGKVRRYFLGILPMSEQYIKEKKQLYLNSGKEHVIMKGIIEGRNPVIEILKSGRDVDKILVAKGNKEGSIHKIIAMAKDKKNSSTRSG